MLPCLTQVTDACSSPSAFELGFRIPAFIISSQPRKFLAFVLNRTIQLPLFHLGALASQLLEIAWGGALKSAELPDLLISKLSR